VTGFSFSGTKRVLREVSSASAATEFLLLTPGILLSAPSGPPSAFAPLLRRSARAKRRNQEKARPTLAPRCARCPALLAGLGPARTRTSLCSNIRAFPPSPAPLLGAIDGTQEPRTTALALDPPSRRSRQQSGGSAAQRARAGGARVFRRYMDVPSENPAGVLRTRRSRARSPGALLFGYFLLGTQEKVTRPPPRRTKLREHLASCEKRESPSKTTHGRRNARTVA
jgi:hypothetical protein